jgi:hypothetical protein
MTQKQQVTNPIEVKSAVDGIYRPKFFSEEAVKALNLRPIKTVWGLEDARPIYNRLPAIEEGYQNDYDFDQPRVYIDPSKNWAKGIGTLEVTRDLKNPAELDIASGTITWKEGTIKVDAREIDTNEFNNGFGLPVGTYQLVYRILPYEQASDSPIPGHVEVEVEDSSISDAYILFSASSESVGHLDYYAIDTVETTNSWRPNPKGESGGYFTGSDFTLDLGDPVKTHRLTVKSESPRMSTATAALYTSDNGIIWNLADESQAPSGYWTFSVSASLNRYLRVFFWDGKSSIDSFSYTGGLYFEDRRVREKQYVEVPVIQDLYEEVKGDYISLATFEVRNIGSIVNVRDLRSVSYHQHQPVAGWLTQFQDDNLRCLFDSVTQYASLSLTPMSSSVHLYDEMLDTNCFGLGEIDLGDSMGAPRLKTPSVVEIFNGNISPRQVEVLSEPTDDSSLTNLAYANYQLYESWSLDNGKY